MSDFWKRKLVRYADDRPVEIPLAHDDEGIVSWVWQFRGNVVPLGFVQRVLKKSRRQLQRDLCDEKIPGWFKTKDGHYRIRHCPEFWKWLEKEEGARDGAEIWRKAQARRDLLTAVECRIAFNTIMALKRKSPEKQFTESDFARVRHSASQQATKRFGVFLERLPPTWVKIARSQSSAEWSICFRVLEWHLTDTMPRNGEEAGVRIWGSESWGEYKISRRREFVRAFRKWKKRLKLQDVGWLPDKSDVESQYGVKISDFAWRGDLNEQ